MLALLRWLVEVMFWMVAGVLVLALLSMVLVPVFFSFAPVIALLLMVMGARALLEARQRRGLAVISYLEQAVRLNLPLPPMLDAAAAGERGGTRRRLARLSHAIRAGGDIGPALDEHVPELKLDAVSMVASGERLGRLPVALRRAVDKQRRLVTGGGAHQNQTLAWTYGVTMAGVTITLITLMMILIIPQYQNIFADFSARLPWPTQITMDLTTRYGPTLLMLSILVMLGLVAYCTASALHPAFSRWRVVGPVVDHLLHPLPVVGSARRDRGLADACLLIADGLRSGAAMPKVLAEAGELEGHAVVKRKMDRLAGEVAAGQTLASAAGRARLPRLMRGMLHTIDQGADATGTFRFLAQYYDSRAGRMLEVLKAAAIPAVVLVLAVAIGWVVLSLFLPLVELMWTTVEGTTYY